MASAKPLGMRIMLYGDANVGKSAFAGRFGHRRAKGDVSVTYGEALVADPRLRNAISAEEGRQLQVLVSLWDAPAALWHKADAGEGEAGASQGKLTIPPAVAAYARSSHRCIFMFDVTSRASLESVRSWMSLVDLALYREASTLRGGEGSSKKQRQLDPTSARILVGNRPRAVGTEAAAAAASKREVSEAEAEAFAEEYGLDYLEVCAGSGEGVKDAVSYLVSLALMQLVVSGIGLGAVTDEVADTDVVGSAAASGSGSRGGSGITVTAAEGEGAEDAATGWLSGCTIV